MAESHVISGLVSKRSELSGLVDHHRKELERLNQEIKALDATIKLFSPEYRIQSIKPKRYQRKNSFFKVGEAGRTILGVLRNSGKPLNASEIAKIIMNDMGIDAGCEKPLQATILTTLRNHQKKGLVDMIGKDRNTRCVWVLIV
ncbi:hypothetical protein [Nitrosomonas sp. Nm33]|uniref:hypothetical protein n=1 Tax=Nitrosomonas sp. Nm33 TaxID=133724 RepID=UPI00089A5097|nr:hypothetical protein [Nitrosomonas sp. Nm33]SDY92378.1 hypothetical protein SAMN05421755_106516 [Nitrosomonas sp. Nm33]